MKKILKLILIPIAIIIALILVFVVWGVSVNNSAINKEEQIAAAESNIKVEIQNRNVQIISLAEVVNKASDVEQDILNKIAEARKVENIEGITTNIQVLVQQYPDKIQSLDGYADLMRQIAILEEKVTNYKKTYNEQVKAYRKHIRVFPNKWFLSVGGYEAKEYTDYLGSDNKLSDLDKFYDYTPGNLFQGE